MRTTHRPWLRHLCKEHPPPTSSLFPCSGPHPAFPRRSSCLSWELILPFPGFHPAFPRELIPPFLGVHPLFPRTSSCLSQEIILPFLGSSSCLSSELVLPFPESSSCLSRELILPFPALLHHCCRSLSATSAGRFGFGCSAASPPGYLGFSGRIFEILWEVRDVLHSSHTHAMGGQE